MGKFVRPALCRLCKFPVGTSGVRLSDVDISKLSRWWKKALQTDFKDEKLDEQYFCQFCLCDAKFQGEHEENDDCDWWNGLHINKIYRKFFYEEETLRPCKVEISQLRVPAIKEESEESTSSIKTIDSIKGLKVETKCIYCSKIFESRSAAYWHVAIRTMKTLKPLCGNVVFCSSNQKKPMSNTNVQHNANVNIYSIE